MINFPLGLVHLIVLPNKNKYKMFELMEITSLHMAGSDNAHMMRLITTNKAW